jgi:hypothetical protein
MYEGIPDGMPEARQWTDWPGDLPLVYYLDLVTQANVRLADLAFADGGAWEVQQEEFIAECMKEQGFTYYQTEVELPRNGESDIQFSSSQALWVPWLAEDLTVVERYGYGYWNAQGLLGSGLLPTQAPREEEIDPNGEYLASLSESAREAYEVALMGAEMAAYDLSTFETVPMPDLGGCMGAADKAHPQPLLEHLEVWPGAAYQDLIDRMTDQAGSVVTEEFLRRADADALNAQWRACFEREYPLTGSPSAADVGNSEYEGVLMSGPAAPIMFDGPTAAWELALNTNAAGEYWDGDPSQTPGAYLSLIGTPREVAIAVADYQCRQQTDYLNRLGELLRQAQEEFLAAHQAQLDEMAAAMEQYISG